MRLIPVLWNTMSLKDTSTK